ncbi:MAG: helix-turn-helix domain-containing protein [Candidatus Micrarchaeia archaeon]|jgi:hypothetical protein
MLILRGTRKEIKSLIDSNPNAQSVIIKVKPSSFLLAYLLNNTKVNTIYCSKGIYDTLSIKIIKALRRMNINIIKRDLKKGRPYKISESVIDRAKKLKEKNVSIREIAKRLEVSWRTLYYRLEKK